MSNEKKISLKPLKFNEAIADILKVKPPAKEQLQPKARQKKQNPPKKAG